MGLVKFGVQTLVMIIDFIFLIKFNMAAHYNNGLSHQKHKKSAY